MRVKLSSHGRKNTMTIKEEYNEHQDIIGPHMYLVEREGLLIGLEM